MFAYVRLVGRVNPVSSSTSILIESMTRSVACSEKKRGKVRTVVEEVREQELRISSVLEVLPLLALTNTHLATCGLLVVGRRRAAARGGRRTLVTGNLSLRRLVALAQIAHGHDSPF